MKEIEINAKTIEDAVLIGRKDWGLEDDEFECEIIDPGSKGFLKIGSRNASIKIKILPKYFSRKLSDYLNVVLKNSEDNLEDLEISTQNKDSKILLFLKGENLGRMIGKHGKTISALQHISNIYINRLTDVKVNVFIEVGDYKDRRREVIKKIAKQSAFSVIKTGKKIQLDPMFAFERRIIHETLKTMNGVKSYSVGLEPYRYVVIEPNKKRAVYANTFDKGAVLKDEHYSKKIS